MTISAKAIGKPAWLWIVAALGLGWNIFGGFQFLASLGQSEGGLMMAGMTAQQAAAYSALPLWMTAAFAIGVFGGIAGSLALLLRRPISIPIFARPCSPMLRCGRAITRMGCSTFCPSRWRS